MSTKGVRRELLLLIFLSLFLPGQVLLGARGILVKGLRWWSDEGYVRVVVDLNGEVSYKTGFVKADPHNGRPPRLYVDLRPARLEEGVPRTAILDGQICRRVRVGQFDAQTVRVVLEVGEFKDHHTFLLRSPYRLVIDLFSERAAAPATKGITLVIDPGHGGKDPGAIGPSGLREKDVVLKVGKLLRDKARERLGWKVLMTREDDRYLPLEERTAIANAKGGDLFLSIHCNASRNRRLRGVETYYLSFTTDREVLKLAARENGVPPSEIDALQLILYDLMMRAKVEDSEKMAHSVQEGLVSNLRRVYRRVADLGVKRAPFVVLVGAKMPSVLAEISFITNPYEERLLRNSRYLDAVAEGLLKGLESYVHQYLTLPTLTRAYR